MACAIAVSTLILSPLASTGSHAAVPEGDHAARHSAQAGQTVRRAPSETCRDARHHLKTYRLRYRHWTKARGAPDPGPRPEAHGCEHVRLLVRLARARAAGAKAAYTRWRDVHPVMTAFERAVALCETHLNYRHHAGAYEGAWGWFHGTWLIDRPHGAPEHAYDATPRQQLLAFRRGWGVLHHFWGCIAHGGYEAHL